MAMTTSALLNHEVYLTDRLDNLARERMPHLKCICFLRPSPESLKALEEELRNPRYSGYWLFFSNTLKKSTIERLAEADEGELVREVQVCLPLIIAVTSIDNLPHLMQEYFADYNAITTSHYTLNCLPSPLSPYVPSTRYRLYGDTPSTFDVSPDTGSFQRHVDGLVALLLSLKKKPVIRYERMSSMAKKLGQEVQVCYDEPTSIPKASDRSVATCSTSFRPNQVSSTSGRPHLNQSCLYWTGVTILLRHFSVNGLTRR
jgi:vacuolar protein sorting-associated protein 45